MNMDLNESYGINSNGIPNDRSNGGGVGGSVLATTNIDFIYTDTDQHMNEIAEFYSYSEENDFSANRLAFEELMEDFGYPLKWIHMSNQQKYRAIEQMAEGLEFTDRLSRLRSLRALLYLVQGNFADCLVIDDQPKYARKNIFQLYEFGLFTTFVQLIHYEIDQIAIKASSTESGAESAAAASNLLISSAEPDVSLRALINIIYLFVEEMLIETETDTLEYHLKLKEQFFEELTQPICGELLHITLFDMILRHCNGLGQKFAAKKILLLLWKLILLTLGDHEKLLKLKNHYRQQAGLSQAPDDTLEVVKKMSPASPPPTAVEMMDSQHQRKMNRPFKRQTVVKQSSFGEDSYSSSTNFNDENNSDDDMLNDDAFECPNENNENGNNRYPNENGDSFPNQDGTDDQSLERSGSPRSSSPIPEGFQNRRSELENLRAALMIHSKGLPWAPKVRQKDVEIFFAQVRKKFIGYILSDDSTTTAGLPTPILESINVLKKHLYISLSEIQAKREEELVRYPLTAKELNEESLDSFVEQLYRAMLPNLPQYLIALLKLLLGAVSNLKSKSESHNALNDIMPQELSNSLLQSIKMKIDMNRHQEIIIKAISGILILLLKHYKINHVYQFEYICQQLMFANCIPLIIKFLSQEMTEFIQSKNNIPVLDFPACVIGEQPELTSDTIDLLTETQLYSWRNIYSSINLLRILNKLTKWKNCRVIMLVIFKSSQPLKRALKVRNAMFQLYLLKLLKIQAKFLGRQWRKSNMKTMSAIYAKVRHRLNDDWAFANDVDTKSIYVQTEEFMLQANINRFHNRRYEKPYPNNINSVTSQALSVNANGANSNNLRISDYSASTTSFNGASSLMISSPSTPSSSNIFIDSSNPNQMSNGCSVEINPALAAIVEVDLLQPIDNNLLSVLSKEIKLTKKFKMNYEKWLEREVFHNQINWDELLEDPGLAVIDTTESLFEYYAKEEDVKLSVSINSTDSICSKIAS